MWSVARSHLQSATTAAGPLHTSYSTVLSTDPATLCTVKNDAGQAVIQQSTGMRNNVAE